MVLKCQKRLGPDVNDALLVAAKRALEQMGNWGLDFVPAYSTLLAAVDAKERDIIEKAKQTVTG